MNFKDERLKRDWTLEYVAEAIGYSPAAVNGLEKNNKGGYELRVKLHRLYGDMEAVPYAELNDRTVPAPETEADIWRRRAKSAERELEDLKRGMKKLLGLNAEGGISKAPTQRSESGRLAEIAGSPISLGHAHTRSKPSSHEKEPKIPKGDFADELGREHGKSGERAHGEKGQ